MIFDGKAFAKEIEDSIRLQVVGAARVPKIVSIVVGNDPASLLYTKLKKQAAERVGIDFEVAHIEGIKLQVERLSSLVGEIGSREDVSGVMVQLPIEGLQGQALQEVLRAIPIEKDVDGLRWEESGVMPATVRSVLSIMDQIGDDQQIEIDKKRVVVLGSRGVVGKPLVHFLRQRGVEVVEVEWDTPEPGRRVLEGEIVISCVGKSGLVSEEMVVEGVIAIDVGMSSAKTAPQKVVGDMTSEVYQKASVAVPVPGGVGPVTVAMLLQNAWDLWLKK